MEVLIHAAKPEHEALFAIGPRGEGHNYFLDAVEELFPDIPDRWVRNVVWRGRIPPAGKDEFLSALADTLRCRSARRPDLAESLRAWLEDRNLVLVHRPVTPARLHDEALILYYTRWLPEMLPDPGRAHGVLKLVQGIDWSPSAPGRMEALGRASHGQGRQAGSADRRLPAGDAMDALQEIRGRADKRLPVFLLERLKPITRKHVRRWVEGLPRTLVGDPNSFVRDVMEGAYHSADVLGRIVERLSAAEEKT